MLKKILSVKKILSSVLFLASVSSVAFASSKKIVLGGNNGWENNIKTKEGLTSGTGRFGYKALQLVTSTQGKDDSTDMLLTFDGKNVFDSTGHYEVVENSLLFTNDAIRGKGAAVSRGVEKGVTLKGDRKSLFGSSGMVGSFTIEFWLCPSLAENGETILSWRSSLNSSRNLKYQMITASFFANHLQWRFQNIFSNYSSSEITLDGITTVIPKKWSRHTLSFDANSGALEYCVDGRTEAIKYITDTKHENGSICAPMIGVSAKVDICPQYAGKIDNFRIDRKVAENLDFVPGMTGNEKYKIDGGKFRTSPILVSHSAVLDEIEALANIPSQTEIKYYVRSGDDCYEWDENYPKWKEVVPGEKINGVSGLYFQLEAELLPDGGGEHSPSLSELTLKYTEQDDPLPPYSIYAVPGDGCVTLNWSDSVDDSAGGYYVYYGNRPGEYLGRVASEGESPINVGNRKSVKITGLKNGTIYYFAVAAYSKIDSRISGEVSKEVFARPSARLSIK